MRISVYSSAAYLYPAVDSIAWVRRMSVWPFSCTYIPGVCHHNMLSNLECLVFGKEVIVVTAHMYTEAADASCLYEPLCWVLLQSYQKDSLPKSHRKPPLLHIQTNSNVRYLIKNAIDFVTRGYREAADTTYPHKSSHPVVIKLCH
jgi:hypothetical protein